MKRIQHKWTKEMDIELASLAKQGYSFTYAADAIRIKFNVEVTRNAVAGRAQRKGVDFSVDKERKVGRPKEKVVKILPKETHIVDRHPHFLNPEARSLKFLQLKARHCRFAIGDNRDDTLRFCGADVKLGSPTPYCEYCHQLVYAPATPAQKRALKCPK